MRRKITYDPQRDYYSVLGVTPQSTTDDIRQAYRRAVRAVHPDLNPDRPEWATEQLQLVNEAYDVLSEPRLRRQYDHVRWPHATHEPPRAPSDSGTQAHRRYRSPFSAPDYRDDRPWWEQVSRHAPSGYASGTEADSGAVVQTSPYWVIVANWLKAHGLGIVEPAWLALVGVWRSPYGGLLLFLGVALAINLTFLGYAFIAPGGEPNLLEGIRGLFESDTATPTAVMTGPTPTPDHLHLLCTDPNVQISQPRDNDQVGNRFSVYGIVQPADLWHYTLLYGYLGQTFTRTTVPEQWTTARAPAAQQDAPEPALYGASLTEEPINLRGKPDGFYVVRLLVTLRDGSRMRPCDVIVLKQ